jgi:hypothetical protein
MSTIREELHALVDRLPQETEGRALKALRHMVECPPPEPGEVDSTSPRVVPPFEALDELVRRRFRQIGQRLGLDVDQLPQNGYCSSGVAGDRVELTKNGESEATRHRLSQIDVQGHDIILLERTEIVEGTELRYEVRVFTDQSEGRAEVNLPI